MQNYLDNLLKMGPEESAAWVQQMAQHAPPPGFQFSPAPTAVPQAQQPVVGQNFAAVLEPAQAPAMPVAGVNAPEVAYVAPGANMNQLLGGING